MESRASCYGGRLSVVQRTDLRGTKLRPLWYRCPGKPYPPQLSNVSSTAVKRIFVSCQMCLCQLSKDGVKIFLGWLNLCVDIGAANLRAHEPGARLLAPAVEYLAGGIVRQVAEHLEGAHRGVAALSVDGLLQDIEQMLLVVG